MIVATAGHVDHGKTALVKALTGMETDRLEEEKQRGLSINLGFAYRQNSKGNKIAFVDVPGHVRFINNMIAGIGGIDLGMLVIAADDGPMPQTLEHLAVLRLLGIRNCIVVISKVDRVDAMRVKEVEQQARSLFESKDRLGVFRVNNIDGEGIDELANHLEHLESSAKQRADHGYFRLPIDRVFSVKGSGLVVTGTVVSGSTRLNSTLTLQPAAKTLRVRGMQVHEDEVSETGHGQRCALNISGDISRENIRRGDWLVGDASAPITERFDCQVDYLSSAPFVLKHMSPVKLYLGARRTAARIALLDCRKLQPGDSAKAQLMLPESIHVCAGDRFLIRDDSESETLGGGIVLDIHPPRRLRASAWRIGLLAGIHGKTPGEVLNTLLIEHGQLVQVEQFCRDWNIARENSDSLLEVSNLARACRAWKIDNETFLLHSTTWQSITGWVAGETADGPTRKELGKKFQQAYPGLPFGFILQRLIDADIVALRDRVVVLKESVEVMSNEEKETWDPVKAYLERCLPNVPAMVDIVSETGQGQQAVSNIIKLAAREKWVFMIAHNRPALAAQLQVYARSALELSEKAPFSVADFRKAAEIGRNLAVEVLEYFDKIGFTLRKDAGRVVLDRERINKLTKT